MGYNINIGEAVFEDMSDGTSADLRVDVEHKALDEAPRFPNDDMTGNGNSRSPGYSVWHEFCLDTGIDELFYGGGWDRDARQYKSCTEHFHRETPLLADHPGFKAINEHDVAFVKTALDTYRAKHPLAEPGFTTWDARDDDSFPIANANLARLIWLHFWMDWAVQNCRHPIVANS
jgi:hypothetical protein